jgi:hypothetical protein
MKYAMILGMFSLVAIQVVSAQSADECKPKYPTARKWQDVGVSSKLPPPYTDNHMDCGEQWCAKSMKITAPSEVSTGEEVTFTFTTPTGLGGPNQVCSSAGTVNWGDSPENEPMRSADLKDCDGKPSYKIAGDSAINVTMKHVFAKEGTYCVSASTFANSKFDDNRTSCSYNCVLQSDVRVTVKPAKAKSK